MLTFLVWNVNGAATGVRSPIPESDPRFQLLLQLLSKAVDYVQADVLVLVESPFGDKLILPGMQPAVTDLMPNSSTQCTLDLYYRSATVRMEKGTDAMRRATVQHVEAVQSGINFAFVAVHLASPQRVSEAENRLEAVRSLASIILNVERREGHRRTLVAGDFNYSPYDLPIYAANFLHAVPTLGIARGRPRNVPIMQEVRPYFYNPMWAYLSSFTGVKLFSGQNYPDRIASDASAGKPAGTYYKKDSTVDCRFWHCPDQVLVRPELLPFWSDEKLAIVTQIDSTLLVTNEGLPDKRSVSDHLPLLFNLEI